MAIIGNLVVGIVSNTKGLKKSLHQAGGLLKGFRSNVSKVTAALTGIGAALGVAAAVYGFKSMATAQLENVTQAARFAKQIGINTKALTGLQYAARQALGTAPMEDFGQALSDMQEKIGDVTLEGGGAKEILQLLGLDADTLATQDPEANLYAISDAIAGMQSQAEKLHVADTLFGEVGQRMLPFLEQGSDEIKKMKARADELGLSFTSLEASHVTKAKKALNDLSARFEGIANQVVIQTAPVITALIEQVQGFGDLGINATEFVATGFGYVAKGVGIVADVVDVLMDGFKFLQSGVSKVFAFIFDGITMLAQGFDWFSQNVLGIETNFADAAAELANDMHKLAEEQWGDAMDAFTAKVPSEYIDEFANKLKSGMEKARNALDEMPASMDKVGAATMKLAMNISELENSLRDQITTLGMTGAEADIYRLKLAGATDEQLKNARKLAGELSSLETFEEFKEQAKELRESLKTPQQKFDDEIDRLLNLYNNDLISFDEFTKGKQNARTDLFGDDRGFGTASEFGSGEAAAAIIRHNFSGTSQVDPQKEAVDLAKQHLAELKQNTKFLQDIAKNLGVEEVFNFGL